jgi:hypothetical protein
MTQIFVHLTSEITTFDFGNYYIEIRELLQNQYKFTPIVPPLSVEITNFNIKNHIIL